MDKEPTLVKTNAARSFKTWFKEKMRRVEILGWYCCYKLVAGSHKENPAKSSNS